jgi:hypothetical protein
MAVSFCDREEVPLLRAIERLTRRQLPVQAVPAGLPAPAPVVNAYRPMDGGFKAHAPRGGGFKAHAPANGRPPRAAHAPANGGGGATTTTHSANGRPKPAAGKGWGGPRAAQFRKPARARRF